MKRLVSLILVLVVAVAVLAACSPAADEDQQPIDLTVTATDIAYDTNQLSAVAGRPVQVTLVNEGALVHDFSIESIPLSGEPVVEEGPDPTGALAAHEEMMHDMAEPDVHVPSAPGSSSTVQFTPSEPGEYTYYCTVEGHREAGMVGTLVVAAP